MRTERRQELRTNELSAQIDQVTEYVKQNALILALVVGGGIVIAGGATWYVTDKTADRNAAWAAVSIGDPAADPVTEVRRIREIAQNASDAALRVAAWQRVGDIAMSQIVESADSLKGDAGTLGADWLKTAEDAYTAIVEMAGNDPRAVGQAMMALGVIAENRGDTDQARQWYQKVADGEQFEKTPLPYQAEYRMANLDNWSESIVFPEPVVTVPEPSTAEALLGTSPSAGPGISTGFGNRQPTTPPGSTGASETITITPSAPPPTPPATTQPAGE